MPFVFSPLAIADVKLVRAIPMPDDRGAFAETYKRSAFAANGIAVEFVQDNVSWSDAGVLRGLHYQLEPAAQAKLVTVIEGSVFDVAVDLRRDSATYGRSVGVELAAGSGEWLYVPVGFAHGFCALGAGATVHYKMSAEYAPEFERGIRWDDASLAIDWPVTDPKVSARDAALPDLAAAEHSFAMGVV